MAEEVKPINWVDQGAHFGSCFVFTLLTMGSWLGFLVVVLWANTREYYQTKKQMADALKRKVKFFEVLKYMWTKNEEIGKGNDFLKRDLMFSYAGVATAYVLVVVPLNIWVF